MRRLKRLKRIGTLGLAGFVAFAPPGTLIVLAAAALSLLGTFWLLVGLPSILALSGTWVLLRRRAAQKNQDV